MRLRVAVIEPEAELPVMGIGAESGFEPAPQAVNIKAVNPTSYRFQLLAHDVRLR